MKNILKKIASLEESHPDLIEVKSQLFCLLLAKVLLAMVILVKIGIFDELSKIQYVTTTSVSLATLLFTTYVYCHVANTLYNEKINISNTDRDSLVDLFLLTMAMEFLMIISLLTVLTIIPAIAMIVKANKINKKVE